MTRLLLIAQAERTTTIRSTILSIGTNLLLFGIFFTLFKPIYDNEDDVYILYKLSGGFGEPPTALVHYNHILHPLLGWPIAWLFRSMNVINWYTVFLVIGHFISCTYIFFRVLKIHPFKTCFPLFLLLFVIFEARLLSNISFSNTAIILGCASIVALSENNKRAVLSFSGLSLMFLVVASFFRIHVLIPIIGVSLPFLLLVSKKAALSTVITLATAGVLIVAFNLVHQSYYEKRIPGWKQEEAYRQKIYKFYNSRVLNYPKPGEKWYAAMSFLNSGLPMDSTLLNSSLLASMYTDLTAKPSSEIGPQDEKPWFWINNRILFFTTILLLLFSGFNKKLVMMETISLVFLTGGLLLLHSYGKIPVYLLPGCLLLLGFLILLKGNYSTGIYPVVIRNTFIALMVFWGIVQYYKLNQQHKSAIASFRTAASTAKNDQDTLLIACLDYPVQKFYVFDLPKKYPLSNVLYMQHFLHQDYHAAFKRFGVASINDLYTKINVAFFQCDRSLIDSARSNIQSHP